MSRILNLLKSRRFLLCCALVLALAAINVAVALLPFRVRYPDVSGSTTYRMSDATRRYLGTLNEDVEIVYYTTGDSAGADRDLYPFLLRYADASPHIRVTLADAEEAQMSDQTIEIRSVRRSRTIPAIYLFYFLNSMTGELLSPVEYATILQLLSTTTDPDIAQSLLTLYNPSSISSYFSGDANLTGAIRYVLAEQAPTVCVYVAGGSGDMNLLLRQQLEQAGYTVQTLADLDAVPETCDALCLYAADDLTEAEAAVLTDYLSAGGALLLTTNYSQPDNPNLAAVLADYGLSSPTVENLLYDDNYQMFYAVEGDHPILDRFDGEFTAIYAHRIQTAETEGVTQTVLLRTSDQGSSLTNEEDAEPQTGSFALCVAAETGDTRLVWLAMPLDGQANGLSGGADFDFAEQTIRWMSDSGTTDLGISDRAIPSTQLSAGTNVAIFWIAVFAVLIPAALLAAGLIRRYARSKR